MPFVPLEAPMLDFAVVSLGPAVASSLPATRVSAGGVHFEPIGDPRDRLWLVSSDPARVYRWPGGACGASGMGMVGDELVLAHTALDLEQVESLSPDQGQYSRFVINSGIARVSTDTFGFGVLFEYSGDGIAIAANRAHLVSVLLAALGRPPEPDWTYLTATLFSEHGFFAQQNALSRTPVEGVRKVEATHALVLGHGRLNHVSSRGAALLAGPESYETLVEQGVEQIRAGARAAVTCADVEHTVVDVTAGKDSRLVLGALLGSPGWQRRVSFNTLGSETSPDVEVATTLVDLVGGRFYEGYDRSPLQSVTLADNMDFWLSYYAGEYHRFGAAAFSPWGQNRTELGVGGACGELYRGFWVEVVQKQLEGAPNALDFASALVTAAAQPEWRNEASLESVVEDLAADLGAGPGETLEDSLEDHYLRHRNRSHCGMRGFTLMHERPVWYPLLSSRLFAASRKLSHAERSTNRVIFDVLARLHPVLVDIPFGNGYPFEDIRREDRTGPESVVLNLAPQSDVKAWVEATRRRGLHTSARRHGKQELVWADMARSVSAQGAEALGRLVDRGLSPELSAALGRRMDALFATSARRGYQLALRILAIDAMIAPPLLDLDPRC